MILIQSLCVHSASGELLNLWRNYGIWNNIFINVCIAGPTVNFYNWIPILVLYCTTLIRLLVNSDWRTNIPSISIWSRRSTADTPTPCSGLWGLGSLSDCHWPVTAVCSSAVQKELPQALPTAERLMQHVPWVWITSHVCNIRNIKGILLQCLFTEVLSVRPLTRVHMKAFVGLFRSHQKLLEVRLLKWYFLFCT